MKLPLSATEHRLLSDLFDARRAAVAFPQETGEAARLHALLARLGEPDLPRADVKALTHLLGVYLHRLAGAGAPVPGDAPLAASVALADQAPALTHIHAQLLRHLEATE